MKLLNKLKSDRQDLITNLCDNIDSLEKLAYVQQAEIERLQKAGEEAVSCFTRMESLYKIKCKELEVAKSEAIKEFADKYEKAVLPLLTSATLDKKDGIHACLDILKEMVGDDNG